MKTQFSQKHLQQLRRENEDIQRAFATRVLDIAIILTIAAILAFNHLTT